MPKASNKTKVQYYGTGRRKNAIARVRLVTGSGNITINDKSLDEFFGTDTLKYIVKQPLVLTNTLDKFDVIAKVTGGGFTGQAGAIRHGISRALVESSEELRPALKAEGFLTRDPRMKERNMVLKKQEKHHNSQRDKKIQKETHVFQNMGSSFFVISYNLTLVCIIFD